MIGVGAHRDSGPVVQQERPAFPDEAHEELTAGAPERSPLPPTEHVVRNALVRFMVSSVVALVVVAPFTLRWSSPVAQGQALRRGEAAPPVGGGSSA